MNLLEFMDQLEAEEKAAKAAEKAVPSAPPVLTVSQLSSTLKNTVEQLFTEVKVEGEISSFKQAASGHLYFNLKDSQSVLNAIVWRGTATGLSHLPQEGQHVVATGRLTTYPARSNYQIIINKLEPAGEGALLAQLEALKKKLYAEGLFDEAHKKPIPYLPQKIGIITSPTGAVIDDMKHRISDRCPRPIILAGVAVQGVSAAGEIISAIHAFNDLPKSDQPDVILLARGGGSLEDLMAFNDEGVIRAIFGSDIPILSGVGHEPDTTLSDFVADRRAPTPSAAAEMAVPVKADLEATLAAYSTRLPQLLRRMVERRKEKLSFLNKQLKDPRERINQHRQRLDDSQENMARMMRHHFSFWRQRLDAKALALETLSPAKTLQRGYTYLTNEDKQVIKSANNTPKHAKLHFHDGVRNVEIK